MTRADGRRFSSGFASATNISLFTDIPSPEESWARGSFRCFPQFRCYHYTSLWLGDVLLQLSQAFSLLGVREVWLDVE